MKKQLQLPLGCKMTPPCPPLPPLMGSLCKEGVPFCCLFHVSHPQKGGSFPLEDKT